MSATESHEIARAENAAGTVCRIAYFDSWADEDGRHHAVNTYEAGRHLPTGTLAWKAEQRFDNADDAKAFALEIGEAR